MFIATVEVIRTQSVCSIFRYEIAITCDDNSTLCIMTVGIAPIRLAKAPALTSAGSSEFGETINKEGFKTYCPDQISTFPVEDLTPTRY